MMVRTIHLHLYFMDDDMIYMLIYGYHLYVYEIRKPSIFICFMDLTKGLISNHYHDVLCFMDMCLMCFHGSGRSRSYSLS